MKYHKTQFKHRKIKYARSIIKDARSIRNYVSSGTKIYFEKVLFIEVLNFETMTVEHFKSNLNTIPQLSFEQKEFAERRGIKKTRWQMMIVSDQCEHDNFYDYGHYEDHTWHRGDGRGLNENDSEDLYDVPGE